MVISIDWKTRIVSIPKSYLTLIDGTLYQCDTDQLRKDLKAIEASEEGAPFEDTHTHDTEGTVAGVLYARRLKMLNFFSYTFEDGQYSVLLVGSNNDFWDIQSGILNQNQVQVIPTNSAGLQSVPAPTEPTETHITVAYDGTNIKMGVWLIRMGLSVINPVSANVTWHNGDGTMLFTINDTDPDAKGYFHFSKVQALVDDVVYYMDVTVVDGTGAVTTRRALSTVTTV